MKKSNNFFLMVIVVLLVCACSNTHYYGAKAGYPKKKIRYHFFVDDSQSNAIVYFSPLFNSIAWGNLMKDSFTKNAFIFKNNRLSECIQYQYSYDSLLSDSFVNILFHSNIKINKRPLTLFGKKISDFSALFSINKNKIKSDSSFLIDYSEYNTINRTPLYTVNFESGKNMLDIGFVFPTDIVDLNEYQIFNSDLIIIKKMNSLYYGFDYDKKPKWRLKRRIFKSQPKIIRLLSKKYQF